MIIPLQGDDLGVYRDDKHEVFEWTDGTHRVVFSATQYGEAISCHFASDKSSLKAIKTACLDFIDWVFEHSKCIMVLSAIDKRSAKRVAESVGAIEIATTDKGQSVYMRLR